jgi:hypothetical protein
MLVQKKSLCIFPHFSNLQYFPRYVLLYVNDLADYFDQVIVAANQRDLTYDETIFKSNVAVMFFKNEGYDLGLFHKVFQTIQPAHFHQIACVNDSNILFNTLQPVFNWSKKAEADFWGLIDSNEKPWFSTHQNNYHIQSHFIVFNENAIAHLSSYFESLDIKNVISEKDPKNLRRKVINQWEIGVSQFLFGKGLKSASYVNSQAFSKKYRRKDNNITHSLYKELIREGYPLIKKKIVLVKNWKTVIGIKNSWEKLLTEFGCPNWDISLLIDEIKK